MKVETAVSRESDRSSGSLDGMCALITGGGTGIGLGIAGEFLAAGAKVIITGRRPDVLQNACARLGPRAFWQQNDITNVDSHAELVASAENEVGALDILVNNAGINLKKPALEVSDAEFLAVLQTNLCGLFALSREVGRVMVQRKKGAILHIASMAAVYGIPQVAAYSAAKSAVLGLTRTLAVELGPLGVRVNALSPGFIHSAMSSRALDTDLERKQRVLSRTPLGRLGTPTEVASAAVFLCSSAASFVTGVNLCVDGGNSIGF